MRIIPPAFREELFRFGIVFRVIVNAPPVRHDEGILWNEVAIVPVILDAVMVVSKLVDGPHPVSLLNHTTDEGEIGLVIEVWGSIWAHDTVQFLLGCCDARRV